METGTLEAETSQDYYTKIIQRYLKYLVQNYRCFDSEELITYPKEYEMTER